MSKKPAPTLPDFKHPPLIEVVCGVQFAPLNKFLVPHFGLYWNEIKEKFGDPQEIAPIPPAIEIFSGPQQLKIDLGTTPPLPRIWFEENTKNGMIQIQRDRFLFNWRKVKSSDTYPRFPNVFAGFKSHLKRFEEFIEKNSLGDINPNQFELTYINHIAEGNGWATLSDLGAVFSDFKTTPRELLPPAETVNVRISYRMPGENGRLHVSIRDAMRKSDGKKIVLFELTARGCPTTISTAAVDAWFELAHVWIVQGFADLTNRGIQTGTWGRTA